MLKIRNRFRGMNKDKLKKLPGKIETERTVIRPFVKKDFKPFKKFMKSKEATQYLLFNEEQKTNKGIKELFNFTIQSYNTENQIFSFVVADKRTDQFIGSVGMAPDFETDAVQIYWSILPEQWNNGYATEAAKALLSYALNELEIEEIVAYSHPDNKAGMRVAEKIGMENLGEVNFDWLERKSYKFRITK
jgi:ribosomal-protein-alanine N-acetyltransferase